MLAFAFLLALRGTPQDTTPRRDSAATDSARAARVQRLESVQVTAVRSGAPAVSAKTISDAELGRHYTGQEMPILLQLSPGITSYAESGSGSNYSYMRMRGMYQDRMNITLDGIPLNEPEDQILYFSNFPDLTSSIASVQVQRGVGTSTHGVASYAGSVNFESVPIAGVSRGGDVELTRGSFNTSRVSAAYRSGLTSSGFAGYLRGSAQTTDGYRYNSGNRSNSWFASGGWFGSNDVVKATLVAGLSSNEQAYYASPLSVLRVTPRDNPFGNAGSDAVDDRFHQDLASLSWTHALAASTSIATTAYGFDAGGWYDAPYGGTTYNYNLHSRWGGIISTLEWKGAANSASLGINASRYAREHWMYTRPDLSTRDYDNTGYKGEQSAFAKGSLVRGRTTLFGDLQLRLAQFRYQPTAGNGVTPASVRWSFVNPKAGVSVHITPRLTGYASVGMNGREPTRADIFAGADDVDGNNEPSAYPLTRVHPESARDAEAGFTWRRPTLAVQGNLFLMQFRNEIAPIGKINEIGYVLHENVAHSVRRGAEGDLAWHLSPRLTAVATASLTDARIREFRDDETGEVFRDATALLTPKLVSGHGIQADVWSWASLDLDGRYTSRMMETNTNDARFVVPASWYADASAVVRVARQSVLIAVRNVFDQRVYTGGYPGAVPNSVDPSAMEPYYYMLAPRNLTVSARVVF